MSTPDPTRADRETADPATWEPGDWIVHRDGDYVLRLSRRVRDGWKVDPGGSLVADEDVPTYWRRLTPDNALSLLFGERLRDEHHATLIAERDEARREAHEWRDEAVTTFDYSSSRPFPWEAR